MCEITAFKLPLFYLFEYVWIYENRPNFNATSLTLFEEHTQAFVLNQSQAVCHYAAYSLTLLVSGWLAGWLPAPNAAGHRWPKQACPAKILSL